MMTLKKSLKEWRERIRQLPDTPGVYLFKDRKGRIIYIGRATRLRQRVGSYFTGKDTRPLIPYLLKDLYDLDVVTTQTPFEALILEAQLIRRHQPRYNTLLRDTRGHPYVRLDPGERFPAVSIVFRTRDDGARYFGPFRSIGHARKVLDLVYRFFRIRQCDLNLDGSRRYPVCLLYHIGRCSGPCDERITPEEYRRDVEMAMALLDGKKETVMDHLHELMMQHARLRQFEAAARYRDAIRTLEAWDPHPVVVDDALRYLDIFGLAYHEQIMALVILQIRQGRMVRKRELLLETVDVSSASESEWWEQVLPQYYLTVTDPPDEIWLPTGRIRRRILERWFRYHFRRSIRIKTEKNLGASDQRLLAWAHQNARVLLHTYGTGEMKDPSQILGLVQSTLGLPTYPYRVEGYDISNIQGKWNVGAMVVFEAGKARKKKYRLYRIRSVMGANDYACMREVLFRRFHGRLSKRLPKPDLILIDGGKGQLKAALEGMREAGVKNIPVIALAKKEELIYREGVKEPIRLEPASPVLRWLQSIRDEAHRTAIQYYRRLHREARHVWTLTEIPGIGPRLAWRIMTKYSGLKELRNASIEELAKIIGPSRAHKLKTWLESQAQEEERMSRLSE